MDNLPNRLESLRVSLTAEVELRLQDAKLIDFFNDHRGAFAEMAAASYEYAEGYVVDTGLPVRRDDVAQILEPALVTNETLRDFLAEKKLRQKYWYRFFADLILDRIWEELTAKEEGRDGGDGNA